MNGTQESSDVAAQLLNSSDIRIAAAARRVFSNAFVVKCKEFVSDDTKSSHTIDSSNESTKKGRESSPFDDTLTSPDVAILPTQDIPFAKKATILPPTNTFHPVTMMQSSFDLGSKAVSPSPDPTKTSSDIEASKNFVPADRKRITSPTERLERSRERNKMHARKTRQRKKEQMKTLENQVEVLKSKQVDLKRLIEEKHTASILVELHLKCGENSTVMDPRVEELLKRRTEDIPDSSKVPELPALILPGQHNSTRHGHTEVVIEYPDDGINYELLAKDRATCDQAELDTIRRERNRMHAKRTRDRKRIFVEEMESIIKKLDDENTLLEDHLESISDSQSIISSSGSNTPSRGPTPELSFTITPTAPMPTIEMIGKACEPDIAKLFSVSKRKADSLSFQDCGDATSTASTSSLSTHNYLEKKHKIPQATLDEGEPDFKRPRNLSDLS